jgi:hypothetical protein
MPFKEAMLRRVAKHVPVDDYLAIRSRRQDLSEQERAQVQTSQGRLQAEAEARGVDLRERPKVSLRPTVLFSRAIMSNVAIDSYREARLTALDRVAESAYQAYIFWEGSEGIGRDPQKRDKAFFREVAVKDDRRLTESILYKAPSA